MRKIPKRYALLFLLPTLIAFCIAFLIPFLMGLYLSFTQFSTVTDASWVGLANYRQAFAQPDFWRSLLFTTAFTICSVVSVNLFAFILAWFLQKRMRGTNLFRTVFFLPNLIGGIVLGYLWQIILNGILAFWGKTLTTDAMYGFFGLLVMMNWQLIGYMMIIYIAGLQNIPLSLWEAARIDGAGSFQLLRHVTLPMLMPSITICLFLTLTNSFKLFDQNLALTAGHPNRESTMLALDIYQTFYGRVGWEGVGQAKAVLFFLIVGIIAMLQLWLTRRKEVA